MSELIPGMVGSGTSQLQSTISAATSTGPSEIQPHHPITCNGNIYYDEDGTFRCDHAVAAPNEARNVQCVNHSIATLLIELAMQR